MKPLRSLAIGRVGGFFSLPRFEVVADAVDCDVCDPFFGLLIEVDAFELGRSRLRFLVVTVLRSRCLSEIVKAIIRPIPVLVINFV